MTTLPVIVAVVAVAAAIAYAMLEKRPGYGVYYGLGKLTGSRLDIGPVNFMTLTRHDTPNDALVCPEARCPNAKPDSEPRIYPMAPGELFGRLKTIVRADANITELSCEPNRNRTARFIQHTPLMRFPDTIDIEVFDVGENQSTFAIYSRSVLGRKDFGVNHARVMRWFSALDRSPDP